MKKALTLLLLFSFLASALAKNSFTLKSGNVSVLKSPGEASVTFDYSKAELEGKGTSLEEYFDQKGYKQIEKWEHAQELAHKDFIKRFNKKSVGLKLVADAKNAKYDVVIQIRTINLGNSVKSLLPVGMKTDGGVVLYGRLIVKDKKGTELCSLRFTNVQGLGTPALEARLIYAYQQLNTDLQKYLKKTASANDEDDEE